MATPTKTTTLIKAEGPILETAQRFIIIPKIRNTKQPNEPL